MLQLAALDPTPRDLRFIKHPVVVDESLFVLEEFGLAWYFSYL